MFGVVIVGFGGVDRYILVGVGDVFFFMVGGWGRARVSRFSYFSDFWGDERYFSVVCGFVGLYGKREKNEGGDVGRIVSFDCWIIFFYRIKERNFLSLVVF